jgi:hypothetical protein
MKHELQNIISGKSQVRHGDAIQAVARYLRGSKSASCETKESKQIKSEETRSLKQFCDQNNFWNTNIDINTFVSSGAEQKVYLQNEFQVFKLNDAFINTRNHDYFHPELGIILEDLHDENVLTLEGNLYFIDTVFYLTEQFYK